MVAPFDVDGVVSHQDVQDTVGAVAAVKDVADDVKAGDGQILDKGGQGFDEARRAAVVDDGIDDRVVVATEVQLLLGGVGGFIVLEMHELVDEEAPAFRHQAADLLPAVFGGEKLDERDEVLDLGPVPGRGGGLILPMLL